MILSIEALQEKIRMVQADMANTSSESGLIALGTYLDYLKDELKMAQQHAEKTSQLGQKD
jgi:hypothetical protein